MNQKGLMPYIVTAGIGAFVAVTVFVLREQILAFFSKPRAIMPGDTSKIQSFVDRVSNDMGIPSPKVNIYDDAHWSQVSMMSCEAMMNCETGAIYLRPQHLTLHHVLHEMIHTRDLCQDPNKAYRKYMEILEGCQGDVRMADMCLEQQTDQEAAGLVSKYRGLWNSIVA